MDKKLKKSRSIQQTDQFYKALDKETLAKAKANDTESLFKIARAALLNNRLGFGWFLCNAAAKRGHKVAKKCKQFLETESMPLGMRRRKCIDYINKQK